MHFRNLPNELQSEIFYHCLSTSSFTRFSGNEAPLLLLSVCQAWKAIILSTPKIWSSFQVHLSGAHRREDEQRALTGVRTCLRLSKAYPLSVKLTCESSQQQSQVASTILSLILHQERRLRLLELSIPRESIDTVLDTSPHDLQVLTSFAMTTRGSCDTSKVLDVHKLGINWSRLTSLYVACDPRQAMSLDSCLDILSGAINLSSCTLDVKMAFDCDAHRNLERVSLPALSEFRLTLHDSSDQVSADEAAVGLVSFFDKLDLPILSSLQIEWLLHSWTGNEIWNRCHPRFMLFLKRMGPTLTSLHLSYLPLAESHVIDCLSVAPFLNNIDLRFNAGDAANDPISDNLLRRLVHKSLKSILLPEAHSFNIQCNGSKCSASVVADLISSRMAVKQIGFKEFKMMTYQRLPVETDLLCRCESEGVCVAFDYIHF